MISEIRRGLRLLILPALWLGLWLGPAGAQEREIRFGPAEPRQVLRLRSTTDADIFGPVIERFLSANPGVAVDYEQWLTNELYDRSREDCLGWQDRRSPAGADVVFSSGAHQMVDLVNRDCAARYDSPEAATLPEALVWRQSLWGVTREPAVIVYNRQAVPPQEVPRTRFDLLDLLRPEHSRYAGRVATYDIEASGLGYLFAFADAQQATTFGALLEGFGRAGAVATCCSAEIIDRVAQGKYLLAYNVLGSYARARAMADPRLGIIAPRDYTLMLSRAVMLPRGAPHPALGRRFLDFLLSPQGQLALRAQSLILGSADLPGDELAGPPGEAQLRPVGLRPPLLVAMDAQARTRFIRQWRDTFPEPAADPSSAGGG